MIKINLHPQKIYIQNTEGCDIKEYGIIKEINSNYYVIELFSTIILGYSYTRCFSKKTGKCRGKHIPLKILPNKGLANDKRVSKEVDIPKKDVAKGLKTAETAPINTPSRGALN